MEILRNVNFFISLVFVLCYAYQLLYIPAVWVLRRREKAGEGDMAAEKTADGTNAAVLICARNEEAVIGDLIKALKAQASAYCRLHIFVCADNCSDNTARLAADLGAIVYVRENRIEVGKGYALEHLLLCIKRDFPKGFDHYYVFDADNIPAPGYMEAMRKAFAQGCDIVTGYRNSKNYGDNWISAGYGLWFLRESRYLNNARQLLGLSCGVSGTGFAFSRRVWEDLDGWPFHLLTEDIEFTADRITKGWRIAFCEDAEFYDEQPVSFKQSVVQRMRWARGYLQVFSRYGKALMQGILLPGRDSCRSAVTRFSCFDMSMSIMPAFVLSLLSLSLNITIGIAGAITGEDVMIAVSSMAELAAHGYLFLFAIGLITTLTEWKHIGCSAGKKILYTFSFPLFMFTFIPVSLAAMFGRVEWKPIAHTRTAASLSEKAADRANC